MGLIIHHLNNSRSQRILWLLEELGLDYQIKRYERQSNKLAPPELKKVHPLGKSPVLEDDGRIIAETGLIVEYLISEYGPQLAPPPSDKTKNLRYRYWIHFSEGSYQPVLVMSLLLNAASKMTPWFLRPIAKLILGGITNFYVGPNIEQDTKFVNDELAKNPKGWLVDEFSGADIIMSFPLESVEARAGLSEYPQLAAYLQKLHARPAYKRALEKGGEYNVIA